MKCDFFCQYPWVRSWLSQVGTCWGPYLFLKVPSSSSTFHSSDARGGPYVALESPWVQRVLIEPSHTNVFPFQSDKTNALTLAVNVEVEPIYSALLGQALESRDVKDLLLNIDSGGGIPTGDVGAAISGSPTEAATEAKEEAKEEVNKETDDDMVRVMFLFLLYGLRSCKWRSLHGGITSEIFPSETWLRWRRWMMRWRNTMIYWLGIGSRKDGTTLWMRLSLCIRVDRTMTGLDWLKYQSMQRLVIDLKRLVFSS